jgi:hypothetical protein
MIRMEVKRINIQSEVFCCERRGASIDQLCSLSGMRKRDVTAVLSSLEEYHET